MADPAVAAALAEHTAAIEALKANSMSIDASWTLMGGFLVVFMHAGFAMLETGSVRKKSGAAILTKNLLNLCVSAAGWFLLGYGFAFGEDKGKFIGASLFAGSHDDYQINDLGTADMSFHYLYWFFQWAFCATAATIVSGAVAERCTLVGYTIFAAAMTTFVYPVIVHWTWGGGWLAEGGYLDFAGSGIVHLSGGIASLVGAAVLGPRTGRFDSERTPEFEPHNINLVILGTLILWFGWYGFNCGSTVSMTGEGAANAQTAAIVAMNTTLAAATGGLVAFAVRSFIAKAANVSALGNGILAGLVSITAGCDGVYPWAAAVMGLLGGLLFLGASAGVRRLRVDDPVDAFAVHGACGIWGVLAVALFNSEKGVFYGGNANIIGWQLLGVLAITAWSGLLSLAFFIALRLAKLLRVTQEPPIPNKTKDAVMPAAPEREEADGAELGEVLRVHVEEDEVSASSPMARGRA